MKKIAIIPARGGSKRLPNKNMRLVDNNPLIYYTIRAALSCNIFDKIYVSSDDERILNYAISCGVQGLRRSESVASDSSTANELMDYLIRELDLLDEDIITYLQPTSPMRVSNDINNCLQIFQQTLKPVISIVQVDSKYYKLVSIDTQGTVHALSESLTTANAQSLPPLFMPNGAIYMFTVNHFCKNKSIPISGCCSYIMPLERSIDIDNEDDIYECIELMNGKD